MQVAGARECSYRIDAGDRVEAVGASWLPFARDNAAPGLTEAAVLGRPVWNFIRGIETQAVYRALFRSVRASRRRVVVPIRCDSPTLRRFMELRIECGAEGALELAARLVREEPRLYLGVLDSQLRRSRRRVEMCSFCKAVHVPEHGWREVDQAIGRLDAFSGGEPPTIDQAVCDACADVCAGRLEPRIEPRMGGAA